jgi:hypothetical protein
VIVGVNGVAESGKDSVGVACDIEWGCRRLAFADRMKEYALAINPWVPIDHMQSVEAEHTRGQFVRLRTLVERVGWDEAKKNPEVRNLLIGFGHGGREVLGENIWVFQCFGNGLLRKDRNYVVTDVRYLNEAEAIRKRGGVIVRVERPGYGPVRHYEGEVHDDSLWDIVIHNDGTLADLHQKVRKALQPYFDPS